MIKGILQDTWWLSSFSYIPLLCAFILCYLLAPFKYPSLDLLFPFGSNCQFGTKYGHSKTQEEEEKF